MTEANEPDVQEQQQTLEGDRQGEAGPDLDRLERDLGETADDAAPEADVVEQSQD